ncbi:uncharacterized protein LAJ45_06569 [Morchella importuna]|uniref:uncharacterized protein n=1 Tax=Morchella importuna TaxID=1174673 RepID=UPI001E8DB1BF|nr:uncharacterized protein LAJ45_06569 [Morchella importuna]KAH8149489.1 hypothetical protein LAJ45_06569 [Morchella importuna]
MPRRRIVGLGGLKQSPPLHPPRLASTLSSERSSAAKGVIRLKRRVSWSNPAVRPHPHTSAHDNIIRQIPVCLNMLLRTDHDDALLLRIPGTP